MLRTFNLLLISSGLLAAQFDSTPRDMRWRTVGIGTSPPGSCTSRRDVYIMSTDGTYLYCLGGAFVNPFSGAPGNGTVISFAVTAVPSWLTGSVTNPSSTPALTLAAATGQTTHKVIGTGATASFGPISLTTADLPNIPSTQITGLSASATTDTTNASNIGSGTLPAGRLPNPSSSTLGGVQSSVAVGNEWIDSISTSGVPHKSQPASSDLNDQTNTPSLAPGNAVVDVASNSFTDESSATSVTTISVGQTVSWKWVSGLHVVVSLSAHCNANPCDSLEDQRFDSGDPTSTAGHLFAYTFTTPGTYYYYCDVHGQMMQGSVVVLQTAVLHTPASSAEACTTGQVATDTGFIYVCVSSGLWKRATLDSF